MVQNGLCAICLKKPDHDLRVDHDHETGKVRGLLCSNCNSGIGFLDEDPKLFDAAKAYCERNKE